MNEIHKAVVAIEEEGRNQKQMGFICKRKTKSFMSITVLQDDEDEEDENEKVNTMCANICHYFCSTVPSLGQNTRAEFAFYTEIKWLKNNQPSFIDNNCAPSF
jgi:hypothetical protein